MRWIHWRDQDTLASIRLEPLGPLLERLRRMTRPERLRLRTAGQRALCRDCWPKQRERAMWLVLNIDPLGRLRMDADFRELQSAEILHEELAIARERYGEGVL